MCILYFWVKSSEPFRHTENEIRKSAMVEETVGDIKAINLPFFGERMVALSGASGSAEFVDIKIIGDKGRGRVRLVLEKIQGGWGKDQGEWGVMWARFKGSRIDDMIDDRLNRRQSRNEQGQTIRENDPVSEPFDAGSVNTDPGNTRTQSYLLIFDHRFQQRLTFLLRHRYTLAASDQSLYGHHLSCFLLHRRYRCVQGLPARRFLGRGLSLYSGYGYLEDRSCSLLFQDLKPSVSCCLLHHRCRCG